ncbi:LamG-like jellyroll fold domain-containing protein [Streptomyces sp. NPDC014006]|uniref:LamG-like jellyroll fold domain-containing protein n=1 Tax=Streptomyces sp. NPDC014006 TaxID=3364870 RepID=UPI0036F4C712
MARRRGAGRPSLSVDGVESSVAAPPGSVSRTSPFGVHLGQRMDGRAFFTGALDELRVWDRALSDGELRHPAVPDSAQHTVLSLPLDRVSG